MGKKASKGRQPAVAVAVAAAAALIYAKQEALITHEHFICEWVKLRTYDRRRRRRSHRRGHQKASKVRAARQPAASQQ